jgi:hypothetical protein
MTKHPRERRINESLKLQSFFVIQRRSPNVCGNLAIQYAGGSSENLSDDLSRLSE